MEKLRQKSLEEFILELLEIIPEESKQGKFQIELLDEHFETI